MLSVIIAPFRLSYSDCYYTGEFVIVMLRFVLLNVVAPLAASLKKRKMAKM
jgi:hypothetical protein